MGVDSDWLEHDMRYGVYRIQNIDGILCAELLGLFEFELYAKSFVDGTPHHVFMIDLSTGKVML